MEKKQSQKWMKLVSISDEHRGLIMNVFILEGVNDAIFISSLLERHFNVSISQDNVIIDLEYKLPLNRGINILKDYLTTNHLYFKIKNTFRGLIIYGDNGKNTVIKYILPTIIFDTLEKLPEPTELRILTILDEGGVGTDVQLNKIFQILSNKISKNFDWSRRYTILSLKNKDLLKIFPQSDTRYVITIKLFQIPGSLEYQIVHEAINNLNIRKQQKEKILRRDLHEAIMEITNLFGIDKEAFIKKSIDEQWFKSRIWYNNLLDEIANFCNLTKVR